MIEVRNGCASTHAVLLIYSMVELPELNFTYISFWENVIYIRYLKNNFRSKAGALTLAEKNHSFGSSLLRASLKAVALQPEPI